MTVSNGKTNSETISPSTPDTKLAGPVFYRLAKREDGEMFDNLLKTKPFVQVFDRIQYQLAEWVKISNPAQKFTEDALKDEIQNHLDGCPQREYGVWVYYPWNEKVVHILDEKEFADVRTNRNLYKITPKEREILSQKKIGIIGLSVGQSAALTLSIERGFGELRIADFDTLDLSNLNRLRTGLHNLGLPKTVIVAREISEIDPFLKVKCFHEGITEDNIDDFIYKDGKLDLLIDECDSLDIKILCRIKARDAHIPVLMDTSDRGMIDIERFDLENNRELFHGLMGDIELSKVKGLTNEQKLPYVLKLINVGGLHLRSKACLIEIGQSISTWPQLSSAVALGGAAIADVSRRILTDQLHVSGRFYLDPGEVVSDPKIKKPVKPPVENPYTALEEKEMLAICADLSIEKEVTGGCLHPNPETIKTIVTSAGQAPSSNNDQPWRWVYDHGLLYLFHDIFRSFSFGDYKNIGSYQSLGAAIENLVLSTHQQGLELSVRLFPTDRFPRLIAVIRFFDKSNSETEPHVADELFPYIESRCTNRKITSREMLDPVIYKDLEEIAKTVPGASVTFITEEEKLQKLGEIISATDRIRILHPQGHYDFFHREMRWTKEEVESKRDGMDIETMEIPASARGALKIVSDEGVINLIREINGGRMFQSLSIKNVTTSSAMGLLSIDCHGESGYIHGGRASQRLWLKATQLNIALQPIIAPLFLFPRILYGNGEGLPPETQNELQTLRNQFEKLFICDKHQNEVFMFRIFKAEPVNIRSLRLPLEDILTFGKKYSKNDIISQDTGVQSD